MNKEQAAGQWQKMKGKIKETWGNLTDDEIDMFDGKKDQFFGAVKEKYGIAKEDAQRKVDEWSASSGYESNSSRDAA